MAVVLIAEDDRDLCWIWSETLADAGHDVVVAHDGDAATEALETHKFDVLVCDVVMPHCGAIVLAGLARRLQPEIRIVAVSGSLALRDRTLGDEVVEADRAMRKPIELDALCAAVDGVLPARAA